LQTSMKRAYQVVPDLPSYLRINPTNTMDGRVEILPPPRVVVPLTTIKDAFVRSTRPTLNYGNTNSLEIGQHTEDNGIYRTFIAFDLSYLGTLDPATEIISAKIRLYLTGDRTSNQRLDLYELNQPWDEHNITWLNQPAPVGNILSTIVVAPHQQIVEWD